LRLTCFALGDLGQVLKGEYDPATVHVKRHLPAVRASAEGALGHRGQAVRAQELHGGCRGEDPRQARTS